jgi:hypothetical protein
MSESSNTARDGGSSFPTASGFTPFGPAYLDVSSPLKKSVE